MTRPGTRTHVYRLQSGRSNRYAIASVETEITYISENVEMALPFQFEKKDD